MSIFEDKFVVLFLSKYTNIIQVRSLDLLQYIKTPMLFWTVFLYMKPHFGGKALSKDWI